MAHPSDKRKNPGIKRSFLALPESLIGTQSYCVTIPEGIENLRALIDLLTLATQWFNWERSDGTEAKQTADAWRDALQLPFLQPGCDNMALPEFRLTVECGLEYSFDGVLWTPVQGWLANAANCFTGTPGADGADGLPGIDGADGLPGVDGQDGQNGSPGAPGAPGDPGIDGADGVCVDCTSEPVEGDTEDWEQQACAMALGLAQWMCDKCVSSIQIVKAAALLAKSLADQASDLLDAIPIFGAIVNNILDFAADMATKGDYDDIMGFINDPDFETQVACKLYCEFKDLSPQTLTVQAVTDACSVVANWAALLPPGAPLITFYGQAFGIWVTAVSGVEFHRHAAVHQDERSDDCALLCQDCAEEPPSACGDPLHFTAGTVNSILDNEDGTFTFNVSSVDAGGGTQYVAWGSRTDPNSQCCTYGGTSLASGFDLGSAVQGCGSSTEVVDGLGIGMCCHYFHIYKNSAITTPWTADITVGGDCP